MSSRTTLTAVAIACSARHFESGSVDYPESYGEADLRQFEGRLKQQRRACVDYIKKAVKEGKRVYAYGASTKGNVILQYYGIDQSLVEGAADRNPAKWGKFTLTDIPIVSEETGRKNADIFLILPYGFVDESKGVRRAQSRREVPCAFAGIPGNPASWLMQLFGAGTAMTSSLTIRARIRPGLRRFLGSKDYFYLQAGWHQIQNAAG